jgi:hypothetical protein
VTCSLLRRAGATAALAAAAVCLLIPAGAPAAPVVEAVKDREWWVANCTVGSRTAAIELHEQYSSFHGAYLIDEGIVFAANNQTAIPINARIGFRLWRYDQGLDQPRFPPEMTAHGGTFDTGGQEIDFQTKDYDPDRPAYPDNESWWAGWEDGLFFVWQVAEVEVDFDRNGTVDCVGRFDYGRSVDPIESRALGDFLATGEGAGGYSGGCRRSPSSYAARWAVLHPSVRFSSAACPAAATGDVVNSQVNSLNPAETDFVTVSVGASETGLPLIIRQCALASANCLPTIANAKRFVEQQMGGRMNAVFSAIRRRAPHAVVEAIGYPRLFGPRTCSATPNISIVEQQRLNELVDKLNDVTAYAAAVSQVPKVHFIDPRSAFASHALCASSPWVRGGPNSSPESYNLNASGQNALFFLLAVRTG